MYRLGLNTGFAVNRFAEPEEWTKVFKMLNINYAQFTADLLNVCLPDKIIHQEVSLIKEHCLLNDVNIRSAFTGAFTRVNHLAHPDKNIREYWVSWFKRYIDLAIEIGAKSIGSHFGILTEKDDRNPQRRRERVEQNIECWHEIARYAKKKCIEFISWEPMSISREQGHTIYETWELNKKLNENSPIPFKICLDVDHGDQTSLNLNDSDPYQWLENFADLSPQIHLKQSINGNSNSNYPFLEKYNRVGRINADKVINILLKKNITDVDLILEINFKERNPIDKLVIEHLNESIQYWKKSIPNT
jgi:D-erythrulose 1-phosphate 3-epimerase